MRYWRTLALATLAALASPLAHAGEQKACLTETPVTAALVAEAGRWDWNGVDANGATPALLFGSLSPLREDLEIAGGAHGAVVFVRDGEDWRAVMPATEENIVGAFVAQSAGALIFATMVQTEGPGQYWTLTRSGDSLRSGTCLKIAFPEELNEPSWANEFVDLTDLDIKANGRGELVGTARIERDGEERAWHYAWRTRDGGDTWTGPHRMRQIRAARPGLYDEIDLSAPAPQHLVEALTAYAAGK